MENYVIKSGTNTWHGSVFDYFRNTNLDTWGFFAPAAINPLVGHAVKPQEHQSEYGVALNGPIKRDKIFFNIERSWKLCGAWLPRKQRIEWKFADSNHAIPTPDRSDLRLPF